MSFFKGFTLAEVLITLGIIGVVAAVSIPTLIQKNNNKVVETRLKKFYSSVNQAIMLAEVDYGNKVYWYQDVKGADLDNEGNPIQGSSNAERWFNKYLAPYMKIVRTETLSDGSYMVYFADGSALRPDKNYSRDWYFYPGKPNKCIEKYGVSWGRQLGVCAFSFIFCPTCEGDGWKYHSRRGMDPYKVGWNGDMQMLYRGSVYSCENGNRLYCTAIIQNNGWKIPDDFPHKVSY